MRTLAQPTISIGCLPFLGGAIATVVSSCLLPSRVKPDFETSSASINNFLTYLLWYMAALTAPQPVVPHTAPEPVVPCTAILLALLLIVVQKAFYFKRFSNKITFLKLPTLFSKRVIPVFEMKSEKLRLSLSLVTYWQCNLIHWPQKKRLEVRKQYGLSKSPF